MTASSPTDRRDADDATVERVAEALVTESFGAEFLSEQTPEWQNYLRRLARAAIAELAAPGTDSSGQAVQRVLDELERAAADQCGPRRMEMQDAAVRIRAAVAGPQRDHDEAPHWGVPRDPAVDEQYRQDMRDIEAAERAAHADAHRFIG